MNNCPVGFSFNLIGVSAISPLLTILNLFLPPLEHILSIIPIFPFFPHNSLVSCVLAPPRPFGPAVSVRGLAAS